MHTTKGSEMSSRVDQLWFDSSKTKHRVRARVVLVTFYGHSISLAFLLDFLCSNNEAKYETLIIGL